MSSTATRISPRHIVALVSYNSLNLMKPFRLDLNPRLSSKTAFELYLKAGKFKKPRQYKSSRKPNGLFKAPIFSKMTSSNSKSITTKELTAFQHTC